MQTMNTTTDYWTATAMAAATAATMPCGGIPITIRHDDGRVYHGCVNEHGEKHGQGALKMDVCVTGTVGDEGSHTVRWTEYSGSWRNGVMHGYGVMRRMTEKGVDYVAHDGMWDDGVPIINDDEENEEDGNEEDGNEASSWQQMSYASMCADDDDDEYHNNLHHSPPGYDHHEEAS